jgi:hypothetical protein
MEIKSNDELNTAIISQMKILYDALKSYFEYNDTAITCPRCKYKFEVEEGDGIPPKSINDFEHAEIPISEVTSKLMETCNNIHNQSILSIQEKYKNELPDKKEIEDYMKAYQMLLLINKDLSIFYEALPKCKTKDEVLILQKDFIDKIINTFVKHRTLSDIEKSKP